MTLIERDHELVDQGENVFQKGSTIESNPHSEEGEEKYKITARKNIKLLP